MSIQGCGSELSGLCWPPPPSERRFAARSWSESTSTPSRLTSLAISYPREIGSGGRRFRAHHRGNTTRLGLRPEVYTPEAVRSAR
jgi:hypothetical protein